MKERREKFYIMFVHQNLSPFCHHRGATTSNHFFVVCYIHVYTNLDYSWIVTNVNLVLTLLLIILAKDDLQSLHKIMIIII